MGISQDELKARMAALTARGEKLNVGAEQDKTYYNANTAAQFEKVLLVWRDGGFNAFLVDRSKLGWTVPKLRAYMYGARRFILDHYASLKPEAHAIAIRCRFKMTEHGCLIVDKGILSNTEQEPVHNLVDAVVPHDAHPAGALRHEVIIFLSTPQQFRAMYERPSREKPEQIRLSSSDIKWIKDRLAEVKEFYIGTASETHVRLVRYSEREAAERKALNTTTLAEPVPTADLSDAPAADVTETAGEEDFFS